MEIVKRIYKISNRNMFNEFYVTHTETDNHVFAGSHFDCVYVATELNETNKDLESIMEELRAMKN